MIGKISFYYAVLALLLILLYSPVINAGEYYITVSPVLKAADNSIYVNDEPIYGDPLQKYQAGAFYSGGKVEPTAVFKVKTSALLIATVKKNGIPLAAAEIIWKINSQKREENQVGYIVSSGEKKLSGNNETSVKTMTLSQDVEINAQYPENSGSIPCGSGKYLPLKLSAGQSYLEISSATPGITDISATFALESDLKKNTVYAAIEWKKEAEPVIELNLSDNGPVYFSDLSNPSLPNFSVLETRVLHKNGGNLEDALTLQLPEKWDFLYSADNPRFPDNFEILKNGEPSSRDDLKNVYKIFVGASEDNSKSGKNVSLKLSIKKGDELIFRAKCRPLENPDAKHYAEIYNIAAVLLQNEIIAYTPITVIRTEYEKQQPENYFSDLNISLKDAEDPVKPGAKISYELSLYNTGPGIVIITSFVFKNSTAALPVNSMIVFRDSTGKTLEDGENFYDRKKEIKLDNNRREAVIYFQLNSDSVRVDKNAQIGITVEYEILKKFEDSSIKKIKGSSIVYEKTRISE